MTCVCERENGDAATSFEKAAIRMMLHNIRHTMHSDPKRIVLHSGFERAAKLARHTGNYQLLSRECTFHW